MSRAPAVAGKRRNADAYPTPGWVTARLLAALRPLIVAQRPTVLMGGLVPGSREPWRPSFFEPCAGRGHIVREIRKRWPASRIEAWELLAHQGSHEAESLQAALAGGPGRFIQCDSLAPERDWPSAATADVCIMNPPFSIAEDFVKRALDSSIPVVAVLERVAWITAAKNRGWLRERVPSLYVLPQRPSYAHCCYYGPGKADFVLTPFDEPSPEGTLRRRASADMAEYAWFVWGPNRSAGGSVLILPDTPIEERKAGAWQYGKASAAPIQGAA